ncbi:hypothetical protein O9929_20720 [Vibrio lentus]|nr:hypothetical protein [Vibrio lentus]
MPIEVLDDAPVMSAPTGETVVDRGTILLGLVRIKRKTPSSMDCSQLMKVPMALLKYELVDEDLVLADSLRWRKLRVVNCFTGRHNICYTTQTVTSNEAVFKIVFDTSNNSYQFELFKPLKHPDGADENSLSELDFSVVAEDFDQDQSTQSI